MMLRDFKSWLSVRAEFCRFLSVVNSHKYMRRERTTIRLLEIASAEDQMALWKLVSGSVWMRSIDRVCPRARSESRPV